MLATISANGREENLGWLEMVKGRRGRPSAARRGSSPRAEKWALAALACYVAWQVIPRRVAAMRDAMLSRITADPRIFGGKPIVRGMRISVEQILSLLAQGQTVEAILDDYPELEADDGRACLAYAHAAIADENIPVRVASA